MGVRRELEEELTEVRRKLSAFGGWKLTDNSLTS